MTRFAEDRLAINRPNAVRQPDVGHQPIRVTSTAICGSDLHLLDVMSPFMHAHDVLGHEPMGIVVEVGSPRLLLSQQIRVSIFERNRVARLLVRRVGEAGPPN